VESGRVCCAQKPHISTTDGKYGSVRVSVFGRNPYVRLRARLYRELSVQQGPPHRPLPEPEYAFEL
jgi:hypothetical protein